MECNKVGPQKIEESMTLRELLNWLGRACLDYKLMLGHVDCDAIEITVDHAEETIVFRHQGYCWCDQDD